MDFSSQNDWLDVGEIAIIAGECCRARSIAGRCYLLFIFDVLPEKRELVPAITHVDGTGRLQTVHKDLSPRYWNLIEEFRKITGVPMVINTSFNVMGEPIICSPEDAVKCFLLTGIDYLCMGDFIVKKEFRGPEFIRPE